MDVHKALDGAFLGVSHYDFKCSKVQLDMFEQLASLAAADIERHILTDCPACNYEHMTKPISITPVVKRTQLEDN